MNRFAITTAALIALSTPALASSAQLAASLGVDADDYTLSELVQLKNAASESGNDARVNFDYARRDMVDADAAEMFFARTSEGD